MLRKLFTKKNTETVRETIEDLIEEADGLDTFTEQEQLILNNVLDLKDRKCASAMIPRANIVAFQREGSIEELAELMVAKGHSRIPVYGESLDDIIGVIHVIDLVKSLLKGEKQLKISELGCRDISFVAPSMPVLDLLREMQKNKMHLAMVIDEYGGIEGLVTIEDLLEEIVGDIEDEYDFEEDYTISVQTDGSIVADARVDLEEILAVTGLNLVQQINNEEFEIDTLGGFVFHFAQKIPKKGDIVPALDGISFKILEVDPRRIKKVLIIVEK